MCELAATGADPTLWLLLGVVALAAGAVLIARTRRGRAGLVVAAVLLGAFFVTAPQPAVAADCAATAPTTTTVLSAGPSSWSAGSAAASQSFTVTNVGITVDALNVVPAISGSAAFAITGSTCAVLAPSASCVVTVAFTPTGLTLAPLSATLTITADNAPAITVVLDGVDGALAVLTLFPAVSTLTLGPGDTHFLTVTNTSATTAFDLALAEPLGLLTLFTTCGASLAPGSSCDLSVGAPAASSGGTTQLQFSGSNTNILLVSVTIAL